MANLITITTPQSPSLTLTTQSNPTLSVSTNNNLTLLNTEWGKLVGDINDQTDLQTLLAAINTTITNSVNSINEAISLLQQAIDLKQSLVDKGIANGYASLNSIGKVPQSQLDITFPVISVNGKTGDVNLSSSDVDLGSVDNTSDLDKPISTATQTALNLKQDSSSAVTLTGIQTLTNKTLTSPVINSPTGLSKGDVHLSAVPNLDTSNPANITQSATYRFVSDTEKTTWNSKQNALGYTPEDISNKSATTTLGTSNTLYPTQGAVKTYVDTIAATKINSSSLATVATSGSYLDLSSRPTIPTNTNQLTNGSGYLVTSNNLSELNAITARTNLGLGTLATQSGTFSGTSSGTNTGDETTATVQSKLGVATTSVSGYLTSTDWNTFNNKQNALGYTAFNKTGDTLTATNGTGLLGLPAQSATPSTPSSGFSLFANSSNALSWVGANGFTRTFDETSNTANRIYTLPNSSGIIALSDNLPNGVIVNGVCYINSDTKPTVRPAINGGTTSSLIVGDRWYNPSKGAEWYWNGTYWLSPRIYTGQNTAAFYTSSGNYLSIHLGANTTIYNDGDISITTGEPRGFIHSLGLSVRSAVDASNYWEVQAITQQMTGAVQDNIGSKLTLNNLPTSYNYYWKPITTNLFFRPTNIRFQLTKIGSPDSIKFMGQLIYSVIG